ncbi:MAG: glyoxal oxidase N-terminus-domain-containing protein [Linnemannia elongata]|nr:MAG: glyoxal oxidase N-terminus-domain-containing protein [Linnemannia elongata]
MVHLRHKRGTILSLGRASAQVLLGALLILSSSPSTPQSPGSLVVAADASLFDSLTNFVRINNDNNRYHFRGSDENQEQQEQLANFNVVMEEEEPAGELAQEEEGDEDTQKGALASILDSVYSFAAKKVGAKPATTAAKKQPPKAGNNDDDGAQLRFQYQGTSRHLGQWDLVGVSGVSAMHATLIPNTNKIVLLEKVEKNTHAFLTENAEKFSFSVEYDIDESMFRPLHTKTNQFCSAGGYRPDGTIVSLGGAEAQADVVEGWNSLRFLSSCNGTNSRCDWDTRNDITLKAGRWYPTVEALADGRLFIMGGATKGASMNDKEIEVPSWELYPPLESNPTHFAFLEETLPYNLYPMAHLLPDGNLFIFANTRGIIFSTKTWSILKNLPELPGPPRNYPLSGGSVLLPLRPESNYEPEILICGGATEFSSHGKGQDQCGRIKPLAKDADWVMEDMPMGRMMPDMTLLPDGSVMMFNGANRGTAGYGRAKDPVLRPIRYQPWDSSESVQANSRFTVQNPSYIPRLYHSISMPVLDGRVMVAGSNPNANTLEWSEFPVEYRVEMFSPGYMFTDTPRPLLIAERTIGRTINRPEALSIQALQETNANPERGQGDGATNENVISFNTVFEIEVQFYSGLVTSEAQVLTPKGGNTGGKPSRVQVNLLNGGFVTHSTHMSQRLVGLEVVGYVVNREGGMDRLKVKGPRDGALTPPGWYQMTVVENGIPSEGTWVRVQ